MRVRSGRDDGRELSRHVVRAGMRRRLRRLVDGGVGLVGLVDGGDGLLREQLVIGVEGGIEHKVVRLLRLVR